MTSQPSREILPSLPAAGTLTRGMVKAIFGCSSVRPYARGTRGFRIPRRGLAALDSERFVHLAQRPVCVERRAFASEVLNQRLELPLVLAAVPPEVGVGQEGAEDEE